MTNEDEGGNNCKANVRIGVKKREGRGIFLKGYWLWVIEVKSLESRVKSPY